jgi:pimeloyl-ACP methyl ester carboxylesterase
MLFIIWFWLLLLALAIVLHVRLLCRVGAPRQIEDFDGVIYRVGRAAVAERRGGNPRATVIAMHGYLENPCYFTRYYDDPGIQLIVLTSGDYHVPFTGAEYRNSGWAVTPRYALGTIEYDAAVLVQALEHLVKTTSIRVHGHSRGGAVVLEAAAMRPDLFRDVEVILEAPILPRGKASQPVIPGTLWLVPYFFLLWRKRPLSPFNQHLYGRLDDPRKRSVIEALPFNPSRLITAMRNLRSLLAWMKDRDVGMYKNVERGAILIADGDHVLDPDAMRTSALQAEGRLRVVEVGNCSHFVLFDRPDAIPPLTSRTNAAGAASTR